MGPGISRAWCPVYVRSSLQNEHYSSWVLLFTVCLWISFWDFFRLASLGLYKISCMGLGFSPSSNFHISRDVLTIRSVQNHIMLATFHQSSIFNINHTYEVSHQHTSSFCCRRTRNIFCIIGCMDAIFLMLLHKFSNCNCSQETLKTLYYNTSMNVSYCAHY